MKNFEQCEMPTHHRFIDLTNRTFGRLTVIYYVGNRWSGPNESYHWLCECSCVDKTRLLVGGRNLRNGQTTSCGCFKLENTSRIKTIHGMTNTPEYRTWQSIKRRCYDNSAKQFCDYGGRGIKMCEGWLNSPISFIKDMGLKPSSDHSIDRIDNDGHYSCGHCNECIVNKWLANCKWSTKEEQSNNTRRNHYLTFDGKTQTVAQWARELGVEQRILNHRLQRNWPIERIISDIKKTNEKVNNHRLIYNGEDLTITEWAHKLEIKAGTLFGRIFKGWTAEAALTTPVRKWESKS